MGQGIPYGISYQSSTHISFVRPSKKYHSFAIGFGVFVVVNSFLSLLYLTIVLMRTPNKPAKKQDGKDGTPKKKTWTPSTEQKRRYAQTRKAKREAEKKTHLKQAKAALQIRESAVRIRESALQIREAQAKSVMEAVASGVAQALVAAAASSSNNNNNPTIHISGNVHESVTINASQTITTTKKNPTLNFSEGFHGSIAVGDGSIGSQGQTNTTTHNHITTAGANDEFVEEDDDDGFDEEDDDENLDVRDMSLASDIAVCESHEKPKARQQPVLFRQEVASPQLARLARQTLGLEIQDDGQLDEEASSTAFFLNYLEGDCDSLLSETSSKIAQDFRRKIQEKCPTNHPFQETQWPGPEPKSDTEWLNHELDDHVQQLRTAIDEIVLLYKKNKKLEDYAKSRAHKTLAHLAAIKALFNELIVEAWDDEQRLGVLVGKRDRLLAMNKKFLDEYKYNLALDLADY